jgi:predicted alpha/beta superfamily hydrolase
MRAPVLGHSRSISLHSPLSPSNLIFPFLRVAQRAAILVAAVTLHACAATSESATPEVVRGGAPIVIGNSYILHSRILGDERRIAVYLPPHYSDPNRTFPVVYLLDGGAAEDFHHITGLASISSAYGLTKEVIVVGIEGKDRRHDLTSPSTDPDDLRVASTSGGAASYRHFLVEELKPWIEQRYRIDGHTALMGESLAGLFVVETALTSPGSFDDYIAISPSLWWNRGALSRSAAANLTAGDFAGRRLWLAAGDEMTNYPEMRDGIDRLVVALGNAGPNGLAWSFTPMPAETHATIYHPAAMAAFRQLYALPRPHP